MYWAHYDALCICIIKWDTFALTQSIYTERFQHLWNDIISNFRGKIQWPCTNNDGHPITNYQPILRECLKLDFRKQRDWLTFALSMISLHCFCNRETVIVLIPPKVDGPSSFIFTLIPVVWWVMISALCSDHWRGLQCVLTNTAKWTLVLSTALWWAVYISHGGILRKFQVRVNKG